MQTFHCSNCQSLVFFENFKCLNCGQALAYLLDQGRMAALTADGAGLWHVLGGGQDPRAYRLCANYATNDVCNWAVPDLDTNALCESCRLTRVIPDLSVPSNKTAWYRLEVAKRRLVHTLLRLHLPLHSRSVDGDGGLIFDFLADHTTTWGDQNRILTSHNNGVITINVSEADDALREAMRREHNEPYRTLPGHFRHESGHYYWDRLIRGGPRLEGFRESFGDERADYAAALRRHYECGPPPQWEQTFVSAYATSHPWEDWAESWAHYLHMTDALETAYSTGLSLTPRHPDEPSLAPLANPLRAGRDDFDRLIAAWLSLTYVLNNLSRGLGGADSYPFVLSSRVIDKLRFVHETIDQSRDDSRH